MPELFSRELLKPIPAYFVESFNADHAGRRLSRWLRRKVSDDELLVAEWLRQGWHKLFRNCRVLSDARMEAVKRALDNEITPAEIAWSIAAYHAECHTNPERLARPTMRRSLESFIAGDALELYIPLGQKLRDDRAAAARRTTERRQRHQEEHSHAQLRRAFVAQPEERRRQLIRRAVAQLQATSPPLLNLYGPTISNPHVERAAMALLQQELRADRRDVTPSVREVMGGES